MEWDSSDTSSFAQTFFFICWGKVCNELGLLAVWPKNWNFLKLLLERIWIYTRFLKHWSIKKGKYRYKSTRSYFGTRMDESVWLHVSAALFSEQNVLSVHWIRRWMSLITSLRAVAKTWSYITIWIPVSQLTDWSLCIVNHFAVTKPTNQRRTAAFVVHQ